ncbi:MAG: ribosome hibernation-promoting factor, HPF/YfiA family [Brevibacterium aurantiacum]|uniref:Ribosome hibernation promoting factor n=1 Tax=Brevibacterium aurantiacum TaxID=273384 RepID=A0A1D7W3J8_BREAU|nr:ribosome-associated translation inhibitor RaiA [Brevibacterium aurantiacum]MDN5550038.1 ribosome-associated translation inhibitor RaiA [Brevibacterium sp.]AOP53228.1 Ribosomal subunit interface protein [Brevibacterium aurantiacum]AZL05462.1 ribosomal subunit interface protein [Brevibacterium aurantiacum]AZL09046.1 ribosomal subunit interface protein [Brevibacterium aurantiacum]AZL12658.1 ribosomal subunit interface protein [Brevibacterium aurantiacum]
MDIVVNGRQLTISDSFRAHIEDKIAKVEQLAPRAQRVEVHVAHEKNSRQPETSERVELTVVAKGPAIRAEAMASDKYAALDLAWAKLVERLRRARDRNKVPRAGHHRKESTAEALAKMPVADSLVPEEGEAIDANASANNDQTNGRIKAEGDSPVVLREKTFNGSPIGIEEALNRMELVGHDFYLFIDEESSKPSVVYRRKGWSYGVIALDPELEPVAD